MKTANELREMLYEAAVRDLLGPVEGVNAHNYRRWFWDLNRQGGVI